MQQAVDFENVVIYPVKSYINSREEVSNLHVLVDDKPFIPVINANMDTTGTMKIAQKLNEHGFLSCLHKYYSLCDSGFSCVRDLTQDRRSHGQV